LEVLLLLMLGGNVSHLPEFHEDDGIETRRRKMM
jgi:hypothetical protein